jgi:hypothetical protein
MRGVEIELGGKSRKLRYDFNAIADIEEQAGLGIGAMFNETRVGFNSIRLLVWGGLKWQERGLTVERAGRFVGDFIRDGGTLEELMAKVHTALKQGGLVSFVELDDEGNMKAETAE